MGFFPCKDVPSILVLYFKIGTLAAVLWPWCLGSSCHVLNNVYQVKTLIWAKIMDENLLIFIDNPIFENYQGSSCFKIGINGLLIPTLYSTPQY